MNKEKNWIEFSSFWLFHPCVVPGRTAYKSIGIIGINVFFFASLLTDCIDNMLLCLGLCYEFLTVQNIWYDVLPNTNNEKLDIYRGLNLLPMASSISIYY